MSTGADIDTEALVDRFTLKAFVESCLVLEEGLASLKDIDLGMMAGAGIIPPPFARADQLGLDEVLAKLETAALEWGENYEPPTILRRLVSQGRLGVKSGQGFFPYARPDAGWDESPVKLETRGDVAIAWLDNPPANSIAPGVVQALQKVWDAVKDSSVRSLVIASASPLLFCAGADIKAFTKMDAAGGKELLDGMHGLLREMEQSSIVTIAAVNALAFGGGCELAMACDIRIAAESATFGQPEINLGIIPGFGGTQRLPRLIGEAKALELNLTGDPISAEEAYELGLANRVVPDHELLDTALGWARKFAGQAPLAIEQIKRSVPTHRGYRRRYRGREAGLRDRVRLRGRPRGHQRVPAEAHPEVPGQVSIAVDQTERLAELIRGARSVVALTGAGISVPSGIPDFRSPGTGLWENVNPMEVAHIDVFRRDPERFWHFYGERFQSLEDKRPNRAHEALAALERAGLLDAVITQNIDRLHAQAGSQELIEVHGTIAHSSCLRCESAYELADVRRRQSADGRRVPRCDCGEALKPDVVLFGEYLPVDALRRAEGLAARPTCCSASGPRSRSIRSRSSPP